LGPSEDDECFYEKVVKVKADVAALLLSGWSSGVGIQPRSSKIAFPSSIALLTSNVFPDFGRQNIN
jgi:hypothetical protein